MPLLAAPASTDSHYASLHDRAVKEAPRAVLAALEPGTTVAFEKLWPAVLEALHLTKGELAVLAWEMHKSGELRIVKAKPRQRTVHDAHILTRG